MNAPPAPSFPSNPAVEVRGLSKSFDGGRTHAVADVSFDIPAGALVALLGASGSGKTTTLKCLNRLIAPDAGTVRIAGQDSSEVSGPELRRRIGYVFQGVGLFPHLDVAANIGVTPRLLGWNAARIAARVDELLDVVALPRAMAGRRPADLSGGQAQRVGLARALAAGPSLMLMDEPFSALDPVTRDELGQAFRDLHARLGLTTIMVTHDAQEAALLADRVIVLEAGRVIADDTPERVIAAGPATARALFEAPRRRALEVQALLDRAEAVSADG